jgi:hypothetical protein
VLIRSGSALSPISRSFASRARRIATAGENEADRERRDAVDPGIVEPVTRRDSDKDAEEVEREREKVRTPETGKAARL